MVEAKGSGYGSTAVPVLKSNAYDLETGEPSVFKKELHGRYNLSEKKQKTVFENQNFCQVCLDGGDLILCPRCPCCVHLECIGLATSKHFLCCPHHHCTVCGKSASVVGGFIFPCSACPSVFCEDHLPQEAKFLEPCDRMEDLGFSIKQGVYVHCSIECENLAIADLDYKPKSTDERGPCPPKLDVARYFGAEIDDTIEAPESLLLHGKRQRKPVLPDSHGTTSTFTANKATIIESPDRNDDRDEDFVYCGSTVPVKGTASKSVLKWHDAVAPQASVQVLVDGVAPPIPTLSKQSSRQPSIPSTDLLLGEYAIAIPVHGGKLAIRIAEHNGSIVFTSYKKLVDGSVCHAERNKLIRNVGDIVSSVGGRSTEGKSIDEVKGMIKREARATSYVALRLFDINMIRFGARPFIGATKAAPKPASTPAKKARLTPPPLDASAEKYTAVIPVVNGQLMIEVEEAPAGGSIVAGYRRHVDGSLSDTELLGLIRNIGDRIIAIESMAMVHMQHSTILYSLRERAKSQPSITLCLEARAVSICSSDTHAATVAPDSSSTTTDAKLASTGTLTCEISSSSVGPTKSDRIRFSF